MQNSTSIVQRPKAWQIWMIAARPRTLPVSLPPILVGTTLAYQQGFPIQWTLSILVLLCSLCLQIGVNLINDALDFKKGADKEGRLGPQRVTQGGLLSFQTVLRGGIGCLVFAFILGIPLILAGGWPLVMILLFSMACAYLYTGGPFPLAYQGLGDLFVFIFFGLVSTLAVYYLQTGTINRLVILAATQIGLLAVVPCSINNLRDSVSDALVNKKTLAVRFGPTFARWEITYLSLVPFLLSVGWWLTGRIEMVYLPLLSLPLIGKNLIAIWQTPPNTRYNEFLAVSARCQLLFGILLSLGGFLYAY
jgi:1,4-dihydroxy-2-naphthoate polyprenyltransferase